MVVVYFEKQVGSLCAQHCLNALLQGSYFTAVELANLAHQLDEEERDVMMQAGVDSAEFIKFAAEGSSNVADDGFYSIQVLERALTQFGLSCTSINNSENKDVVANPLKEDGFICNLSEHWFTLRKIQGSWFDLNSIKKPTFLSDFYVSLYLETLRQQGWNIFVVRGNYPQVVPYSQAEDGKWIDVDPSVQAANQSSSRPTNNNRGGGNFDPELEAALKLSLQYSDENETYKPKGSQKNDPFYVEDDDDELMKVMELSRQEEKSRQEREQRETEEKRKLQQQQQAAEPPKNSNYKNWGGGYSGYKIEINDGTPTSTTPSSITSPTTESINNNSNSNTTTTTTTTTSTGTGSIQIPISQDDGDDEDVEMDDDLRAAIEFSLQNN
ncbi:hypothetical protein DFA_00967 [Cavenderia fasciculata]|uniref:ubiquitinyl hydrolase 1 n=1 Tax=Cavenderia fasciculata TaxID=261658 RepID=F4PUS3_CACFS|nr:uncharacterized protein DFA_00967 [Cavenderia fasciculata]EGG21092.1 hypothetical protein DFA_00967 [Cavenderia fasciculata]|eukprot:XP_004358942.1 hypothetical protein DFA_00967 [Cavenderia fasciculata]